MAVIGRAARHGQIEVGTVQQARRLAGLVVQPAVDDFQDALLDLGRLEHAAVEQNGRGVQKGGAVDLLAVQALDLGQRMTWRLRKAARWRVTASCA
jgi:hypothetical protein